jgi:flagellar motor switch protein FliN/FliY
MSRINESINESIASFLDAMAVQFQRLLSQGRTEQASVSWNGDRPDSTGSDLDGSDLVWWSCALSVDPACRIYAGAERRTWMEIGGTGAAESSLPDAGIGDTDESWFAFLTAAIERAARARFGALVSCTEATVSEDAPPAWVRVTVAIGLGGSSSPRTMNWVLSPELATALGGESEDNATAESLGVSPLAERDAPAATSSLEILHHVEIPVSVSFGRTQMRLKDLLALSNGSVVQLDRELGDEVEIRVNNCVIARGEVVAVDGNYGVRILEMATGEAAPSPGGQGVRGALRAG